MAQPNEIKVGDVYVIERRFGYEHTSNPARASYEKAIAKVTPKRAYFDDRCWFALDDPQREVKPQYLDYRTIARPKRDGE